MQSPADICDQTRSVKRFGILNVETSQSVIYICQQDINLNLVAGYVYVCVLCVCARACVKEYVQFESCQHPVVCSAWENFKPGQREHRHFGLPASAAKSYGLYSTGFTRPCSFCLQYAVTSLLYLT